jgi:hypothetical protein
MDAARVSKSFVVEGFPGVDAAHPGDRVHLLMYYTVLGIPKDVRRTYRYDLIHDGKVVYSYPGENTQTVSAGAHRFVYFTDYVFPPDAAFGLYTLQATLALDGRKAVRSWTFAVTRGAIGSSGRP